MRKTLSILLFLLFLAAAPAGAQLKKKIFQNCSEAQSEFEHAQVQEKEALIPYLRLVLQLESHSERKFESRLPQIGGGPGSAGAGFAADDFLSTLDRPRKLEARACAVSLLEKAGLISLAALPEIARLADDPGASFNLQESTRRTAIKVASLAAAQPGAAGEQEAISGLIDILAEGDAFYGEAVICELGEKALSLLFKRLPKLPENSRGRLAAAIICIDPQGAQAGPWLLGLLKSGDEALRLRAIRMLGDMSGFYDQSLPALIKLAGDISADVHQHAVLALGRIFKSDAAANVKVDAGTLQNWLAALQKAALPERASLEEGLGTIAARSPGFEQEALALMSQPDIDLRARLLGALGRVPDLSDNGFGLLVKAMSDPAPEIQVAALDALGQRTQRREQVIGAFLKLLKSNASSKDLETKQKIVLRVAQAVIALEAGEQALRMTPYFVEALSFAGSGGDENNPAINALFSIGPKVAAAMLKVLQSKDPLQRRRAALVLGKLRAQEPRVCAALVELLRDSEEKVRKQAESSLLAVGPAALPELRRALKWQSAAARLIAARLLAQMKAADKAVIAILQDGFRDQTCPGKAALALQLVEAQAPLPDPLWDSMLECLTGRERVDQNFVEALVKSLPPGEDPSRKLAALIREDRLEVRLRLDILERGRGAVFTDEEVLESLRSILKSGESPIRYRVVSLLGKMGTSARGALPEMLALFAAPETEPLLKDAAAVSLARIEPAALDYVGFIVDELASERFEWAAKSLHSLGWQLAWPVIQKAWQVLPFERRYLLVRALGDFGPEAGAGLALVKQALVEPDWNLRYHSAVALLEIDSSVAEALPALRAQLASENARRLTEERLDSSIRPLLSEITANPQSRLEERNARALESKLKSE